MNGIGKVNNKMRILFLTKINFWSATNTGGKMISKRNYELLKDSYGEKNLFYCVIDQEYGDDYINENRRYFGVKKGPLYRFYNYLFLRSGYGKNIEKEVVEYVKLIKPDILFFDGTWYGGLLKKIKKQGEIKVITFYHNIEANVAYKKIFENGKFRPHRYLYYWCTRFNEKYLTHNSDVRVCLNQRDSHLLEKLYGQKADFILPTTIQNSYHPTEPADKSNGRNLLFVGVYFIPNVHGVKWFVKNVLPYINATLYIVGHDMERLANEISSDKLIIKGEVDDLSVYYEDADAIIEPIFLGDGMKTKTAEAMMYGKAIFATDEALEGYDVADLKNIARCNTSEEFIKKISEFLDKSERYKWYFDVREAFMMKYEFSSANKDFIDWLKQKL